MSELVFYCYFIHSDNAVIPAQTHDEFCREAENQSEFIIADERVTFKYKQAVGDEVYKTEIFGRELMRFCADREIYDDTELATADTDSCSFRMGEFQVFKAQCTVTLPLKLASVMTSFVEYCKNDPDMLITFKVDGKEVKAVTNVMMFKSPVVGAMMRMDCIESKTRVVKIEDFSFEVMQKFVEFCETDTIKVIDGLEMDLCKIADKYDVEPLKKLAGTLVADSIGRDNVLELFLFAKTYSIKELEAECIRFGRKHWMDIHEATVIENATLEILMDFWSATRR